MLVHGGERAKHMLMCDKHEGSDVRRIEASTVGYGGENLLPSRAVLCKMHVCGPLYGDMADRVRSTLHTAHGCRPHARRIVKYRPTTAEPRCACIHCLCLFYEPISPA
ncbi:hypothetical protein O0L34_g15595 [Tuta absoluta]|nr:hypothetical protein O0L34_g15595 [Tuta absoluta]